MKVEENYKEPQLTPTVLWLMAVSSALVIGNIYYNQPLLSLIAKDINVSESNVSKIAMLTQIGYAMGLLFIVPLGDLFRRKQLILYDFGLIIISVLGMALSKSIHLLYIFSFLIGFTSVVPQILVPMAATLAQPEKRTHAIGFVMSGLLLGILGSRIISGWMGNLFGWRSVFFFAAGVILFLWFFLMRKLPEVYPQYKGTYAGLMKSVLHYAKTEPVLQAAALRGGFLFASFCAFWTALVFHLEQPPFNAGSAVAGSFGIIGMAGAFMAAFIGRIAKKLPYFSLTNILFAVFISSWLFFWIAGNGYIGLIIGVIVLDIGMQALHIMNQTSIFSLHPNANNRLNTVYMTTYFIGGATGTFLAGLAWQNWQWDGVLVVGAVCTLLAVVVHFVYRKAYRTR